MSAYASASIEARKFMAFGSRIESYKREREQRAALLMNNNKQWSAAINTNDFAQVQVEVKTPVTHSIVADDKGTDIAPDLSEVIQLDNLLLPHECQSLIQTAESVGFMGSNDLAALNFPEYSDPNDFSKNSARVLIVEDEALADVLWQRLSSVILDKAPISELKSSIYGTFSLQAYAICPLMRILRYEEGQQFKPHVDGVDMDPKGPNGEFCRSRLTLALYLNKQKQIGTSSSELSGSHDEKEDERPGDYHGGAFRFLQPPRLVPRQQLTSLKHCTIDSAKLSRPGSDCPLVPVYPHVSNGGLEVSPDEGRAILFGQDTYHEGLPVHGGSKYMIQTSVMYELIPDIAVASKDSTKYEKNVTDPIEEVEEACSDVN